MKIQRLMVCLVLCSLPLVVFAGDGKTAKEDEKGKETPAESGLVQKVLVTASRADEDSPATFTNVSKEKIEEEYYAQDIPALLRTTPSVYSYSDSGNDVGYSYLRLRGFDQARMAVTINGVPLNDAESHEVYWIDLPNFPDSLEDMQIQRGAGTSVYGGNAVGGTVNLETARLAPGKGTSFNLGYGSYATAKASVSWGSELVAEHWVFGLQLSHIETDGYRDQSWSDLSSAFFTAQRVGEDSLLRINVYGGREESHLAYEGITREQLEEDRRQNPLDWGGEIDHFTQPHLEIIHEYQLSDRLEIANTVYYFEGDGYFNQFRERKSFHDLRLPDWDWDGDGEEDSKGPIFRRRQVNEWDLGWSPRLSYRHDRGTLTAGAMIRRHEGKHYGRVTGALPPGTPEPFNYYDFEVPKTTMVVYLEERQELSNRFNLVAGLQYVDNSWKLRNDRVTGLNYDVDYSWFAPRIGLNARFSERLSAFVSIAHSRREPRARDLYDPSDVWIRPAFESIAPDGSLSGPLVDEEKLDDYELGLSYNAPRLAMKATLYDMEFKDELVYLGGRNDLGEGITGNADRSVHRGVELEVTARLAPEFEMSGHAMLSDDRLTDFVLPVYNWETGEDEEVDLSGNRIAFFPNLLARLTVGWTPAWGRVDLGASYSGRIYLDNEERQEMSIDPFTVFQLSTRIDLGPAGDSRYALRLQLNNLLDHEYEAFGYSDWGTPVFIPAAGRHLFAMLSFKPRP